MAAAINLTRHRLRETYRRRLNQLDVDLAADGGVLTFTTSPDGVTPGTLLGVGTELVYVSSVDNASQQATILRGIEGSVVQAHLAGTLVDIEPRFPDAYILDELRNEIRSWGPELFRVESTALTGSYITRAGNLDATDFYGVLGVTATPRAGNIDGARERLDWSVDRNVSPPVITFTGAVGNNRTITVLLAVPFDTTVFTAATDLEATVGIPTSCVDVAAIGAAYRVLTEVPRTSRAAATGQRDAEDVPAGLISSIRQDLAGELRRRLFNEQAKLRARYPVRMQ